MSNSSTPSAPPRALKVVIAGGFGVGKTTLVGEFLRAKFLA